MIAEGVSRFGIAFISHLRGMYAGVAINTITKEKYVFRDPLGEKPLFYTFSRNNIWFSSEFLPLLKILNRPLKPNPEAFSNYFRFGYAEEPLTFDLEIHTVTRGSIMKIIDGNSMVLTAVLSGYDLDETSLPLQDLISVVNSEVVSSTVPIGLALSVGGDSSSLLFALEE